ITHSLYLVSCWSRVRHSCSYVHCVRQSPEVPRVSKISPAGFPFISAIVLALASCVQNGFADSAVGRCGAVARKDLSDVMDAQTHIMGVKLVESNGDLPAYCDVEGAINPTIGIEIRLPINDWNGKFLQAGCGGFCGATRTRDCENPLRKGYACISSDM